LGSYSQQFSRISEAEIKLNEDEIAIFIANKVKKEGMKPEIPQYLQSNVLTKQLLEKCWEYESKKKTICFSSQRVSFVHSKKPRLCFSYSKRREI